MRSVEEIAVMPSRDPHEARIRDGGGGPHLGVMWSALAVMVDLIHALAMVSWVAALPLLFVWRWPRLRLACAIYAVFFVVVSRASMLLFHECFLTDMAGWLSDRGTTPMGGGEWFTERFARLVFGMAPSREVISRLSEALIRRPRERRGALAAATCKSCTTSTARPLQLSGECRTQRA